MLSSLPRVYPLLGFCVGYALVMLFNPVRQSLRDGLRCLARYPRVWMAFVILGFAYAIFQFSTFTPIQSASDLDLTQLTSLPGWQWPGLAEVWVHAPLPTVESVAGLFDDATTTYPLSVLAAILLLGNWRGLHAALWHALRKRFGFFGFFFYLILSLSAVAAIIKPFIYWRPPYLLEVVPETIVLRVSATLDTVSFIFEYLCGVYIQVYLITVCLVWIKGLSFNETQLFNFAVRRFSYVLEWAGIVALVSALILKVPTLVAYFTDLPGIRDYEPFERMYMCLLILTFASVQISLALHNETLREAVRAHFKFLQRNFRRFAWFLLIAAFHFFFVIACDAIVRGAIADRLFALLLWTCIFVFIRGLITGWLLASWVCLFRHSETGWIVQESWIQY